MAPLVGSHPSTLVLSGLRRLWLHFLLALVVQLGLLLLPLRVLRLLRRHFLLVLLSGVVPRNILLMFELVDALLHGWGLWRVLRQRLRQWDKNG